MTYKDLLATMQAAEQSDAELLKQLKLRLDEEGERIILEIEGKPFAALISLDDLEFFAELEDAAELKAAREAFAEPAENISIEELRRELKQQSSSETSDAYTLTALSERLMSIWDRVVIEVDGKPFAALISLSALELFEDLEDAADVRAMEEAWQEGGELVSLEEIQRDLEQREISD